MGIIIAVFCIAFILLCVAMWMGKQAHNMANTVKQHMFKL